MLNSRETNVNGVVNLGSGFAESQMGVISIGNYLHTEGSDNVSKRVHAYIEKIRGRQRVLVRNSTGNCKIFIMLGWHDEKLASIRKKGGKLST